jgi:hypothetical protein
MSANYLNSNCKDNNIKKQQPPCVTSLDHFFIFLDDCFQINPFISSQAKVASNLSNENHLHLLLFPSEEEGCQFRCPLRDPLHPKEKGWSSDPA